MSRTKKFRRRRRPTSTTPRQGKVKYALAMWLLGLPLPIIAIALFWGGCDF